MVPTFWMGYVEFDTGIVEESDVDFEMGIVDIDG